MAPIADFGENENSFEVLDVMGFGLAVWAVWVELVVLVVWVARVALVALVLFASTDSATMTGDVLVVVQQRLPLETGFLDSFFEIDLEMKLMWLDSLCTHY